MSYQSEVLADTPILYYRLDQAGAGVDGEAVPDIGSANLPATLHFTGSQPPWGHVSPIQSDPPSREFWGYTNAGVYGFSGESFIDRASDAAMTVTEEFTVEEWLRPMDTLALAGTFAMAQKQGTGGTSIGFSGGVRIGGFCFDSAATLWEVFDPSIDVEQHIGESFHVVVFRTGDALALVINGTLRNVTTIASGLPTLFNSSPFRIHPNAGAYTNARHDEVAFYNYALGVPRSLAHYEAAFDDLIAHAECHIRTTAVLQGSVEPDPVEYPFRHNWTEPVLERLSWKSSVYRPADGAMELGRQRLAPRRSVEYQHLLYNEELRRRYEARAFGGRTALVQFEPDKVQLVALAAGAISAVFDTTLKDFEVGHRVLFYQDDDLYEYATLTVVDNTHVEWDVPLSRDYTNVWVKPARVARLQPETQMEQHTDTVGDSSTIYSYEEADEPLVPRRLTPYTPTLTYRSRDLWDLREWQGHNYVEIPQWEWQASRSEVDGGTGLVSTKTYRWGAEMLQPWNMLLNGRTAIAKYLGWLYQRRGQYSPFWMPTFKQDLKPLGVQAGTGELIVQGHEYSNLYAAADNRLDLAFVYNDNTYICGRVQSLVVGVGVDLLTLDIPVPTFTNLRWLSFLRRVVLSSDDLELAWETDDKMRVAFAVVDAPLDWAAGSPSVSPSLSASGSPTPSPSPSASGSVSPSGSASPSPSGSPSGSASPTPSASASQSPSASGSPSSSASPSRSPSGSASPSASVSPSSSASASPSSSPSVTPSLSPSASLSPSSSASPST